ncbi:hypothetical protein [Nostoc sp. C117]
MLEIVVLVNANGLPIAIAQFLAISAFVLTNLFFPIASLRVTTE